MTDFTSLTIADARDGLAKKSFTSLELTDAHLKAMEDARALNAFVLETPEHALAQAGQSDARLTRGEGGPLEGLPLGIKDLFCTEGHRTTAGSKILGSFVPQYESTVSANLWRDGAVMSRLRSRSRACASVKEVRSVIRKRTCSWVRA